MTFCLPDAHTLQRYQGVSSQEEQGFLTNTSASLSFCQHVRARAAATALQEAFLVWQQEARQKQGEAGLTINDDYAAWFSEQTTQAQKEMCAEEQACYEVWARMQDDVYRAWAQEYTAKQEHIYALEVQQRIIASSQELIKANINHQDFVQQGLEQIAASTREWAFLQGLHEQESTQLQKNELAAALYAALMMLIERGEQKTAKDIFLTYNRLLLPAQVKKIDKMLRILHKVSAE